MRLVALFAGLMLSAVPAAAQNMQEPASTPPAGEQAPAAEQPRAASPAETAQLVQTEFAARDRNGDGSLNQAEFSAWVGELMARRPGQASPPSEAQLTAAFARADADRNQAVSQAEMTALFSRTR
ncbi:hypothetical protein [Sphingosinicella sp.]|uniref:hypothetical protein n=1 Tax=Sphingosinicella sp. TaxID=1917971 RepID=UPI0040382046